LSNEIVENLDGNIYLFFKKTNSKQKLIYFLDNNKIILGIPFAKLITYAEYG
jgi:hypothetical protein